MLESSDVARQIQSAVKADADVLTQFGLDVCLNALYAGSVPEDVFDALMSLLLNPDFHNNVHAANLIKVLEDVFAELTAQQKARLLPVLQEIFGKFREWLASYIIAIVLAESYDSGEATEVLIGLATAAPPAVRDCVASGLGRIRDPASRYREARFRSLTQLSRDKNPQARMAALEALSRQRSV